MRNEIQIGVQAASDATVVTQRGGKGAEGIVGQLHGRFYEQCYRGNCYTFGISNTALVAANAIATGLTATAQMIIGLYNPSTSQNNLVVLQAMILTTTVANTAVSPGGFMWVYSSGNPGVSTGSTPINCKSLVAAGSSGKAFAVSTATTGLTNNLAALRASSIQTLNNGTTAPGTSVHQPVGNSVDNIDGGFIVPPGGVLGLMGQVSTTTISVSSGIFWEEVPV